MPQFLCHPDLAAPRVYRARTTVIAFDNGYADYLVANEELQARTMFVPCQVPAQSSKSRYGLPTDGWSRSGTNT